MDDLQLGEFSDDPGSWLPDHLKDYDSSGEYTSEGSDTNEDTSDSDLDLVISQHHPDEQTWFLNRTIMGNKTPYMPVVHTIGLTHEMIENDEEKKLVRPLLVSYGTLAREIDPDNWIKKISKMERLVDPDG